MTISKDELDAIRAGYEASTSGTWTAGLDGEGSDCITGAEGLFWARVTQSPGRDARTDACFIANAHRDIPRLLDYIAELEEAVTAERARCSPPR